MNTQSLLTKMLVIFFIISFSLIIFGILHRPKLKPIKITSGSGSFNKSCLSEKISCNTDYDCMESCSEAQEGEEIICKSLPEIDTLTETQRKLTGLQATNPSSYCVPAKAVNSCDISHGGIPTYSGWSNPGRMEFDCMCAYPLWASSRICDKQGNCSGSCMLNPDVCKGGVFDWDLTKKVEEPRASLCTCGSGDTLLIDNFGLPRCVPEKMRTFYKDLDD